MGRLLDEDNVIDIINFECGKWTGLSKTIEKEIKALPSAQPEREKGKWIVCGDKHVCSECDEFALCDAYDVLETGEYQEKLSDFCPNCGADMRTKETDCDYERAVEQLEHDMLYEPTFNQDDGSM